jgi:two-component system response regulator AtoC
MAAPRVLIVDDDPSLREALGMLFEREGWSVSRAETGAEALAVVRGMPIEVAFLDLRLGEEDGLDLLPHFKSLRPEMSVIVITALGTIEAAVEAMRRGADNFVVKPVDPPRLLAIAGKGLESQGLRRKTLQLERAVRTPPPFLPGASISMREVLRLAEIVAVRDTTVLIVGETGTGKGLLARRIHDLSPRRGRPFLELNCAGLQKDLTESELFGHERGAFTGAAERKIGLFEAAHEGSLFLDEIGEMEPAIQAKLLKVLEEKRFRRVGGLAEIEVDVRLIAATHRDLERDAADGRFRSDLLYRLNVFTVAIAPLRDRPEDVAPLVEHFLAQYHGAAGPVPRLGSEGARLLREYRWPGNVRELRNVIERAAILCGGGAEIAPDHLPLLAMGSPPVRDPNANAVSGGDARPGAPRRVQDAERELFETTLRSHGWNIRAAARSLGVSRGTLYRKAKKYGIALDPEGPIRDPGVD